MEKLGFTIDEAVKSSGIGRTKIYEFIKSGQLKRRKVGRRTIIIVAHRQSTLAGCDQILHVEGGKVTAGGRGAAGVRPPRASAPPSIRSGRG